MNTVSPKLLYCDPHLLVCHKPRLTLSEGEGATCLPTLLSAWLSERGEKSTAVYPVHRLDRETEGVMVFARTKQAAAGLSLAIAEDRLEKEYLALLCGCPPSPEGELTDLLFYDRTRSKSFVVTRERKGVKRAALTYRVLEERPPYTLVRVSLQTGRTHQIRVQFASRGMPLRGDRKYGAPREDVPLRLCACRLRFPHPITGERMEFTTEPEEGWL